VAGAKNYSCIKSEAKTQDTMTLSTMLAIGDIDEDVALVNMGVQHIGWTVLEYYYPNNTVYNCGYREVPADDIWYFSEAVLGDSDYAWLSENGYQIEAFGEQQLSKYHFNLYHICR